MIFEELRYLSKIILVAECIFKSKTKKSILIPTQDLILFY